MSLRAHSVDFERSWPPIERVVLNILHQRYQDITTEIWQETFFDVYQICVATENLVGPLYLRFKTLLQKHVEDLRKLISNYSQQELLTTYHSQWVIYKAAAEYLDKLFSYLNTQHLKKIKKPMPVEVSADLVCKPGLEVKDLCFYIWTDQMIIPLRKKLVHLLLSGFESYRKGMSINQTVTSGVILSLALVEEYKKEESLELYREIFELPFLQSTGEYYNIEAEKFRSELNCSDYMKKVLQIIDLESFRCTQFIHPSSKDKVISEIRARMVADHSKFLHKESEKMVSSDCWQDLHALYKLLKPIEGGLKTLIQQVQTHITRVGLEAVKQVYRTDNPPKAFVDSFIQVYTKHSKLMQTIFNNDQLFVGALDKACSAIINHRINPQQPCKSPELLAKYCDSLLRKPGSNSGQGAINKSSMETEVDEVDEKLALSIIVFKYIDDKDIFQKFYSKNMARRLIFSQLNSMEAEESMINKLKQVCGYEFTAKLHRMFTDIGVSCELRESFNQHLHQKGTQLGISFSIYVLQAGSWPLGQSPVTSFALPQVLANSVKAFEDYYYSKFNGRVLTWLYHHCTADLKINFQGRRQYYVSMQTFHAAILLLYENVDELTYEEISKATQLSEDQLSKHLQGLIEIKILMIDDESPTEGSSQASRYTAGHSKHEDSPPSSVQQYSLNSTTRIKLNLNFTSKRPKFKIAFVQRDTQYQHIREQNESEQTHSSIDEDRKLNIQAAIVRVMKSRKTAKHNQLIQEVIGLTKNHFTPCVPMIKKCIEMLIEKQYIERKGDVADEYKYVA